MRNRLSLILYFLFIALFPECVSGKVATGAERFEQYLPFIRVLQCTFLIFQIF